MKRMDACQNTDDLEHLSSLLSVQNRLPWNGVMLWSKTREQNNYSSDVFVNHAAKRTRIRNSLRTSQFHQSLLIPQRKVLLGTLLKTRIR